MSEIVVKPDRIAYRPGDVVRVEVSWADADSNADAQVSVGWFTRGKGTQDRGTVGSQPVSISRGDGQASVEFTLPDRPYSFSGALVSVVWEVKAALAGGQSHEVEIVVSPTGAEIDLYKYGRKGESK